LIGVDSLGIDVRAFSGLEARTVRFSFNAQALSERSAEKKIRRMLFPRYQRKSVKTSLKMSLNLSAESPPPPEST